MKIKRKTLIAAGILAIMATTALVYAAEVGLTDVNISGSSVTVSGTKYYTGDTSISYKATGEAGIDKVSLTLNGQTVAANNFDSETEVTGSITADADFLAANEPSDYKYSGKLTATDAEGTAAEQDISFYADASVPAIQITGVQNADAYKDAVTVKVKMTDGHIDDDSAGITINKDGETLFTESSISSCKNYSKTLSDEGTYTVSANVTDRGSHAVSESLSFTIDKQAPQIGDVAISGEKASETDWYNGAVTVSTEASDALSGIGSVKLFVDGNLVKTFEEGPFTYEIPKSWLADHDTASGKHEVKFTAEDKAGNTADATGSFYADCEGPDVTISGVTDGSFINSAPVITVAADDSHADETTVYADVYRSGEKIESLSKKGGQITYTPEQSGVYKITAYAQDAAKNRSEDKEISFTFDTVPPDVLMNDFTGHKNDGFSWFDTEIGTSADISDDLSGLAKITLYVNEQAVKTWSYEGSMNESVSEVLDKSWITENESEDGKYTVKYVAADRCGNEKLIYNEAYADVKEPSVSLSGIDEGTYTNETPQIKAEVTDNYPDKNTIHFTITRDGKTVSRQSHDGKSAKTNDFKEDGRYVVSAYCLDKAGNKSPTVKLSFVKDTVAPVLSLSGAKNKSYYSSARTIKARVRELNYENMSVSADVKKVLDEKEESVSFGKISPTSSDYTQSKKFAKTGTYTVTLKAKDKAGNTAKPVSLAFTVDREKPVIKITGVKDVFGYSDTCAPRIEVTDSYYDKKTVRLSRASGSVSDGIEFKDKDIKRGSIRKYSNFTKNRRLDDVYTLRVTAYDKAGNTATETMTFTVCRFGSVFSIRDRGLNGAYVKSMDKSIVIIERTPANLTSEKGILILDGREQDADVKIKASRKNGWNRYSYSFPASAFSKEGVYTLNTSSQDDAGNTSSFAEDKSFTLYVDKTPPVVALSGIEEKSQYKMSEAKGELSVSDNIKVSMCSVKADGLAIYEKSGDRLNGADKVQLPSGMNQTITVTASDMAGNISTYELEGVTVSDNLLMRLFANRIFDIALAAVLVAAAALFILLFRRRRKEEEE